MTITITTLTCSYDTTILDTLALPLPLVLRLSLLPLQLPPEPIVAAVAAFATAAATRRGARPSRRPIRRDCAVWIRNERSLAHLRMYDRADFSTPSERFAPVLLDLLLPSTHPDRVPQRSDSRFCSTVLRVGAPAVSHYGRTSSSPAPAVERRVTAPSHSRMREFT